jgi:hypothetical protein
MKKYNEYNSYSKPLSRKMIEWLFILFLMGIHIYLQYCMRGWI